VKGVPYCGGRAVVVVESGGTVGDAEWLLLQDMSKNNENDRRQFIFISAN
jgi:hypothetical protein